MFKLTVGEAYHEILHSIGEKTYHNLLHLAKNELHHKLLHALGDDAYHKLLHVLEEASKNEKEKIWPNLFGLLSIELFRCSICNVLKISVIIGQRFCKSGRDYKIHPLFLFFYYVHNKTFIYLFNNSITSLRYLSNCIFLSRGSKWKQKKWPKYLKPFQTLIG